MTHRVISIKFIPLNDYMILTITALFDGKDLNTLTHECLLRGSAKEILDFPAHGESYALTAVHAVYRRLV